MLEGRADPWIYSRFGHDPLVQAAQEQLACLEGGSRCILTSSGMAAVALSVTSLLEQGDAAVLIGPAYGTTQKIFEVDLPRRGVRTRILPARSNSLEDALRMALKDAWGSKTPRLVFFETPTNPTLDIVDIAMVARCASEARPPAFVVVDNTFASPYNQRPLALGADVVVHSATKYLAGHSDVMLGTVVFRSETEAADDEERRRLQFLRERYDDYRITHGPVPDPWTAYFLLRSIQTLPLRVAQQNKNALAVAKWLEQHPAVASVTYPGLPTHPRYAVAEQQMRTEDGEPGFGGMISFAVHGDARAAAAFLDSFGAPYHEGTSIVSHRASLGSVKTILESAAMLSHFHLSPYWKERFGITKTLIRLSVGTEDVYDIIADLDRGLTAARRALPRNASRKKK